MDIRKIKKLIELVEESGITELEVSEEEGSVRISRATVAAPANVQYSIPAAAPTPTPPVHCGAISDLPRKFCTLAYILKRLLAIAIKYAPCKIDLKFF